jgi:hypothetical protein
MSIEHMPVTFRAQKEFVEAVFQGEGEQKINIRFESPEQMLEFFQRMMEVAAVVWSDNEFIQEFLNGE